MSAAVATGLFTLGGVIVGGLLNTAASHAFERRRENRVVRKAARLFNPRLHRLIFAIGEAIDAQWKWGDLVVVAEANIEDWEADYAPAFADTMSWDWWFKVYAAVRALQKLTWITRDGDSPITDADRPYLEGLIETVSEAAMILTVVALSGSPRSRPQRLARKLWYRIRPPTDEDLDDVLADHQAHDSLSS